MPAAAALLLIALHAAAAEAGYRDEADLFTQVCTQGGGRFAPGSIEPIAAISDARIRNALPPLQENRFYQVRLGRRQVLLILQDTIGETDPNNYRHCSVATGGMNFGQAVRRLFPGHDEPDGWRFLPNAFYLHSSPLGHRINIQRLGRDLLLLTAIVPAPEAARNEEVLRAFRDACDRAEGRFGILAKHATLGWQAAPAASDPRLERAVAAVSREHGAGAEVSTYQQQGGGRPLFLLVTSAVGGSSPPGHSCRLYDFDAGAPIHVTAVQRWLHLPPERLADLGGGGSEQIWSTAWDKDLSLRVQHIPRNSSLAQQSGFSGNVLVVRAVGDP